MIRPTRVTIGIGILLCLASPIAAWAQGRGARGGGAPTGRGSAQVDLTGNWVSVISEDWRWRMITPPKGDFANIPVNAEAKRVGEAWDPAKDEAAGEQCKGYAAPAIMREPGRLRISWQDDDTLKIETDAGQQTRLFHFSGQPPQGGAPSWQGYSSARWEVTQRNVTGMGSGRGGAPTRTLEVVTTQLRPGYLRKNGIPFGANAVMTEYYDAFKNPDGTDWFTVTTIVTDPQYLGTPWVTSTDFKKEPDGSKWKPTPCKVR